MTNTKWNPRAAPYGPKWSRHANQLARDFAPEIYPCPHCQAPRARGYCCTYCGSGD